MIIEVDRVYYLKCPRCACDNRMRVTRYDYNSRQNVYNMQAVTKCDGFDLIGFYSGSRSDLEAIYWSGDNIKPLGKQ